METRCPRCSKFTYAEVDRKLDILPTPPGTNWLPLPRNKVTYRCSSCGYTEHSTVKYNELMMFKGGVAAKACPNCNNTTLVVEEERDLIDELSELAAASNTEVEVISNAHEEGEMLYKSFGGIAALLAMLNSCAAGVAVVNIDNGFGAGYIAGLINRL